MSKCGVCNEEYSEEFKMPKILPCGHTYCIFCVVGIFQAQQVFVCPDCKFVIKNPELIKTLPNNYAIIQCIREMRNQASMSFSPYNSHPFLQTNSMPLPNFSSSANSPTFSPNTSNFNMKTFTPKQDSFSFYSMKKFLDEANVHNKDLFRSFTPKRDRTSVSPRKIDDFEINEKGIFREKPSTPIQKTSEMCIAKNCYNQKMYYKGSYYPFCSPQCEATYYQTAQTMAPKSPINKSKLGTNVNFPIFSSPINTKSTDFYGNRTQRSPSPSLSQRKNLSPNRNSLFQSPKNPISSPHQFGKTTSFELLKFYEKSPQKANSPPTRMNSMDSNFLQSQNSFLSQSSDTNKSSMTFSPHKIENQNTFLNNNTLPENKLESDRCVIPGCSNKRFQFQGTTYPFCSMKCWKKWPTFPEGQPQAQF